MSTIFKTVFFSNFYQNSNKTDS